MRVNYQLLHVAKVMRSAIAVCARLFGTPDSRALTRIISKTTHAPVLTYTIHAEQEMLSPTGLPSSLLQG